MVILSDVSIETEPVMAHIDYTAVSKIYIDTECLESEPCQHGITVVYHDGTEEKPDMDGVSIHAMCVAAPDKIVACDRKAVLDTERSAALIRHFEGYKNFNPDCSDLFN